MTTTDPAGDWWTRLYPDDHQQPQPQGATEGADERRVRWWMLNRQPAKDDDQQQPAGVPAVTDQPTVPPGLQITITQPPPVAPGRTRLNPMLLAYYGTAAVTGWWLGLGPTIAAAIDSAGDRGGLSLGMGLVLVTGVIAAYIRGLPIPIALRPAVTWCSRIPVATAVLALALHTT